MCWCVVAPESAGHARRHSSDLLLRSWQSSCHHCCRQASLSLSLSFLVPRPHHRSSWLSLPVAEWHSDSRGRLSGVFDTIANPAVEPVSEFMSMPPSFIYSFGSMRCYQC
jgi:hypothetical protein